MLIHKIENILTFKKGKIFIVKMQAYKRIKKTAYLKTKQKIR